jgi:hypothetical protein
VVSTNCDILPLNTCKEQVSKHERYKIKCASQQSNNLKDEYTYYAKETVSCPFQNVETNLENKSPG